MSASSDSKPASSKPIIGEGKAVQEMMKLISKVTPIKTNVLIIGESGTGKELVARLIHDGGPMKDKPFVPVNCGAIPENLIESEFFGHKRGSFTGAVADKKGLFEVANGGTLFLDEVGELPLNMQAKLLRAIQERTIRMIGGNDDIKVNVRIIAATNKDLEKLAAEGKFREDLYYRLNVILIRTPPLRERKSDLPLLIDHFISKFAQKYKQKEGKITPEAMTLLQAYEWPGNIRELENLLERVLVLTNDGIIRPEHIPDTFLKGGGGSGSVPALVLSSEDLIQPGFNLPLKLKQIERYYIDEALKRSSGNEEKAAKILGVTALTLKGLIQSKNPNKN